MCQSTQSPAPSRQPDPLGLVWRGWGRHSGGRSGGGGGGSSWLLQAAPGGDGKGEGGVRRRCRECRAAGGLAPAPDHTRQAVVPPKAVQQAPAARRQEGGRVLGPGPSWLRPRQHPGQSQPAQPLHQADGHPVPRERRGRAGRVRAQAAQSQPVNLLQEELGGTGGQEVIRGGGGGGRAGLPGDGRGRRGVGRGVGGSAGEHARLGAPGGPLRGDPLG